MNALRQPPDSAPPTRWWQPLLPAPAAVSRRGRLRASAGALIGILLTGFVSAAVADAVPTGLWLMAPMGASAVLLFGVPSSPLAQPWAIVGGNLLAAVIGVACARWIAPPVLAAAAAIALSVAAMFAARCLHPPSGAVALTAVLGGEQIHAAGFGFVALPVALNTALLLAVAVAYNSATGRRYPHAQQAEAPLPGTPAARFGFDAGDLRAALADHDEVLDVSLDDLERLFERTEQHAFRRRFGDTRCGAIMATGVPTAVFATELDDAWALMQARGAQALPVLDRARRVIGIVTRADFLRHAGLHDQRGLGARLRALLRRTPHSHSDKHEVVGQIMSAPVHVAPQTLPAIELVPQLARSGHSHVPIVDAERRFVGLVTQRDLVEALYAICMARVDAGAAVAG